MTDASGPLDEPGTNADPVHEPHSVEPSSIPKSIPIADSPHLWVASTYFAEGLPYGVVHTLAEVLFKNFGASLGAIGLTALFHLPWNLKFLWGPLLDLYGTKRRWILGLEAAIVAGLVGLSATTLTDRVLAVSSTLFLMLAVVSATHDAAIDGFYLEALDKKNQSKFVGYRGATYRTALLVVRGGLVALVGLAGWLATFLSATAIFALVAVYHALHLPRVEVAKRPIRDLWSALLRPRHLAAIGLVLVSGFSVVVLIRSEVGQKAIHAILSTAPFMTRISTAGWIAIVLFLSLLLLLAALPRLKQRIEQRNPGYASSFITFLDQPRVGLILAFVILFRAGESFLEKMRIAFLLDSGLTEIQLGFVNGTLAVLATIGAIFVGGWLISRHGLARWIWPFALLQNLPNLLYAGVGIWPELKTTTALYAVVTLEAGGAGFGTAVFLVYLMRCVKRGHTASHMAIVTALMSLGFTLAGAMSGFIAESFGYGLFFAFTFVAAIPAMLLIPFLPHVRP